MKIQMSKKDAIWGYISTICSMCINFVMLPFILYFLDSDSVGMYYIFVSLGALVNFFDFGFGPAFSRSVSYAWSGANDLKTIGGESFSESDKQPNYVLLAKMHLTCKLFYFLIAILALLLSLTIGYIYIYYVGKGLANNKHLFAWGIYSLGLFLNLLFSYYSTLLRGIGAISYVNKSMVYGRMIQVISCVIMLIIGTGLIGIAVAYLLYGLVFRLLLKHYYETYKDVAHRIQKYSELVRKKEILEVFGILWPNTWREGVVTLSNYISNQGTTIICSLFFSLYQTGLYSLTNQLVQAVATISSSLYNTYLPVLQSAFINKDIDRQRKTFSLIIVTYVSIFFVGMLGISVFGPIVVQIMKPEYNLSYILLLVVGSYQFILKYRNCYVTYFSSTNRVIYYKAYLISSIFGVVLSYIYVRYFNVDLAGMVMMQIISQLIYNAWYWSLKANKEMGINTIKIFKIGLYEIQNLIGTKNRFQ